jgi:3-methylcrotonyl-CoA carboxylase alpha subunit
MFDAILIANRGEIACRIARTCRRMGIASVAVYSEADRHARHVSECDIAMPIGPAEAAASYLNAQAIVDAALRAGAQAVHPGYGFLSEKTVLAELCAAHGIEWIGPRPEVIRQMGSKIESKLLAQRADVPTVPGYHGEDQTPAHLLARAEAIGWPLLIKASAGGGGRGMRRVENGAQFLALLDEAKSEALRAFGDDRVLLEKLIARPRHLEVQLIGDRHGNLLHLFERECSIQRNYQKVIEEAPAAWLAPETRERLHAHALRLGRAIGYDSAGTVEFVLEDGTPEPYFLEMNTRLQVEHPVTELVTGLDLVELQIRVAAGEVLPLAQHDIAVRGHAIEARVNCEDPAHGYRPQIGTITGYEAPEREGLRIDSGVQRGSEITPHYDSMIAKVIGFGGTRATATRRLVEGLDGFHVDGVGTNQAFLRDVVTHALFQQHALTTHYLAEAFPDGWRPAPALVHEATAAALFSRLAPALRGSQASGDPWGAAGGFRVVGRAPGAASTWVVEGLGDEPVEASLSREGTAWRLRCGAGDATALSLQLQEVENGRAVDVTRDGQTRRFGIDAGAEAHVVIVSHGGQRFELALSSRLDWMARPTGAAAQAQGAVRANMPGMVTEVHVAPGQQVKAGDLVAVMDSMKLLYSYAAAIDGEVMAVACKVGQTVASGQLLVEIAAPA